MVRTYLGPSVGWVLLPGQNILPIQAGGTTIVVEGTSLVLVNFNGAVTIILPSAIHPSVSAGVIAPPFADLPITIVDIGGFAGAHPITIQPASGAESIMGLASIQITAQYGSVGLRPSNTVKGWTQL